MRERRTVFVIVLVVTLAGIAWWYWPATDCDGELVRGLVRLRCV